MVNKKINQLVEEVVREQTLTLTPNQKEQVKSILLKRFTTGECGTLNKDEVKQIIKWVTSTQIIERMNLLRKFSFPDLID